MTKFSIEEISNNLINLEEKLKTKDRKNGFWVIATRSDYRPLKVVETKNGEKISRTLKSIKEVKDILLKDKEQYFKGKKLANVYFYFFTDKYKDPSKLSNQNYEKIKNEVLCGIAVDIFLVNDEGKIQSQGINAWECHVNFTIDDLTKHKLLFSDSEIIMRNVADRLVTTVGFGSVDFKDFVSRIKKIKSKNKKNN